MVRQIAERMVRRGHEVTVATTALKERTFRNLNGVHVEGFDVNGHLQQGLYGEVDRYREFVISGRFDALMVKAAQQWTFDALWPILDKIRYAKVFIPCGFSGLYRPEYTPYYAEMPAILRTFDRLIFYASDYRDINFARKHGLSNFSVIPNGASEIEFGVSKDSAFRSRHGIAIEDFVILTVGSLTGLKGHLEIAEAFQLADFRGRAATLILNGNIPTVGKIISGPNPFRSLVTRYRFEGTLAASRWLTEAMGRRLKQLFQRRTDDYLARLRAIVDSVNGESASKRILLADLPRSEVIQAYLNSDLFVFASHIEYSPLVLYEAAAAGLPFLSVPVGNAEEIARWTKGGSICPAARDEQGYIGWLPQCSPNILLRWRRKTKN